MRLFPGLQLLPSSLRCTRHFYARLYSIDAPGVARGQSGSEKRLLNRSGNEILPVPTINAVGAAEEGISEFANELERDKVHLYRLARMPHYQRNVAEIDAFIEGMLGKYPPNMHLFNIVLYARITLNHVKGMKHILDLVNSNGLVSNEITYNNLIGYYRNNGRPEDAEAMLTQMVANKRKPSRFTYTTLVSAFSKTDIGKAREYFDKMKNSEEPSRQPDVFAYNTMVGAYMKNGQFGQADALVKEMGQAGVSANFITFKIIIEGLLKSRFADDAWKMYNGLLVDCKEMSKADFVEIHTAFVKASCYGEAMEIFHEMERRFDQLDSRTVYPALMYTIKKTDSGTFQKLVKKHILDIHIAYKFQLLLHSVESRTNWPPLLYSVVASNTCADAHEQTKRGTRLQHNLSDCPQETISTVTIPTVNLVPRTYFRTDMVPNRIPMHAPTELPMRAPIWKRCQQSFISHTQMPDQAGDGCRSQG
ncbi:hypothetical protein PSACC_01231 [Paramicrosporidium saccamoebae]|uniref:Pentacotripeptide-repeat region of PRORP domain-containing protein n=1 Tax=Paramicrosporidium saccamoebae TaxID=1246581 RepID=A0A2H9TML1_9FUNG|nr:hypothetical protein PSACC_01231 [Paramicrosporidium saccamoebae]